MATTLSGTSKEDKKNAEEQSVPSTRTFIEAEEKVSTLLSGFGVVAGMRCSQRQPR